MEDDAKRATNCNFNLQKLLDVARQDMPETQEKQWIGQSIPIDGGPSAVKTPNLRS